MSKKLKEVRRKEQLMAKDDMDAFRCQVKLKRTVLLPGIPADELDHEIESVCMIGLSRDILDLGKIIKGIKNDLGIAPEPDMGTLAGSPSAYLLGITERNPYAEGRFNGIVLNTEKLPLQIEIYYDNEVRNLAVEWVKERYGDAVTTRLGQPILKLKKMVVAFRRVVRE